MSEFVKGIHAERSLAADAKATADSPPDPSLGVLYHEIAVADERHVGILETIARRLEVGEGLISGEQQPDCPSTLA